MGVIELNLSEFSTFFTRMRRAANGGFKRELERFLQGIGANFLRLVEDEIKRRKVMDTRLLLASFEFGGTDDSVSVWKVTEGGLTLEVGTNVQYAAYVNDGHWTNPEGVERRYVPGHWERDRFIYEKGAKTGMVLKQHWVMGTHYWEGAIGIFEKMFPDMLDKMLQKWLDRYFGDIGKKM